MDKRGEMARERAETCLHPKDFVIAPTAGEMVDRITKALEDAYRAGLEDMREAAARTAQRHEGASIKFGDQTLMSCRCAETLPTKIRALPLDPKEAQDAEG